MVGERKHDKEQQRGRECDRDRRGMLTKGEHNATALLFILRHMECSNSI